MQRLGTLSIPNSLPKKQIYSKKISYIFLNKNYISGKMLTNHKIFSMPLYTGMDAD